MITSRKIIVISLVMFVFVIPVLAQDIFEAARKGDLNTIKNLLKENKDLLESLDQRGRTPLHVACLGAQVDVVKYLIDHGANINALTSYSKSTTLHLAVHAYPVPVKKKKVVEVLLSKSPEFANMQNNTGITPLMWAANDSEETIQLLMDHGADVNAMDFNGYSSLHSWTRWWPEDKSEFLIQQGANVNAKDKNGRTPLHVAAIAGRENRARLLLKYGGDINAKDNFGYTPLDLAVKFNHKTLVDFLKKENGLTGNFSGSIKFNSYLTSHFNEKEALIWYLDSNGWAIKTRNYLLIFDFTNWGIIPENQSLYNGRINLEELKNLSDSKIIVFKSGAGRLDKKIITLKQERENVIVVSGSEIPEIPDTKILTSYSRMTLNGLAVNATKANAGELGFIIEVDGLTIYYAGNHGLWNDDYSEFFFSEINYVKSNTERIDFAFFPITNTGDLTNFPVEGMITAADELKIKALFPMGGSGTAKFYYKNVVALAGQKGLKTRVICVENRGDRYFYRNGKIQNSYTQDKSNDVGQNDFPVLKGPYLGQRPPGMTPEIFAPGIISTNMNAAKIVFSPDGKEIFFRLMNYNHSFYTIVFMRQENGVWSKPEVAPFSGKYHDTDPYFSLDGKQLFFGSNRPLEGQKVPKDPDIWVVERKESGWSSPVNLGSIVNSDKGDVNPAVSQNGTLYFSSNRDGGKGNHDIYMSKLINGKYAQPENLGDAINTSFTESGPYLAPDESYIIFNRYSSDTGSGLHISFRKNDGSWSKAINMGKKINTENAGMHGFVSPDSKYLFFTSERNPYFPYPDHNLTYDEIVKIFNSPLNGSYNIYWVDAKIIEQLRQK